MRAGMRAWLGRLAPTVVVLCLSVHPGEIQAQGPPDVEATIQKTVEDAKLLAKEALPPPDALGEGGIWKLPWQLPPQVPQRFESEEKYWQAFAAKGEIAGVTEEQARAAVHNFAAQFAAAGQAEGLGERAGVITLLLMLRGQNASPAVNMETGLLSLTRGFELAKAAKKPEDPKQPQRALLDAIFAPFQHLSTEKLLETFVREATLIKRRTGLSYLASNNWQGVVETTNDQDFVKKGLWVGVVKVRLMLVDRQRVQKIPDLKAPEVSVLDQKLDVFFKRVMALTIEAEEHKLAEAARQAEINPDENARQSIRHQIAEQKMKLADSKAAAAKLRVAVLHKRFGDNSYIIRISGASPEALGLQMGVYTGWLRNGHALVEVSMGGNFPEEQLTEAMESFLKEMDARTRGFAR